MKDALFYGLKGKQGGDKYTGGSYDPPLYDKENPRVEITLWLPDGYDERRDIAIVSEELVQRHSFIAKRGESPVEEVPRE